MLYTVQLVYGDHQWDRSEVVLLGKWSPSRGELLNKNRWWDQADLVSVDKWSPSRGGLQVKLDCNSVLH